MGTSFLAFGIPGPRSAGARTLPCALGTRAAIRALLAMVACAVPAVVGMLGQPETGATQDAYEQCVRRAAASRAETAPGGFGEERRACAERAGSVANRKEAPRSCAG